MGLRVKNCDTSVGDKKDGVKAGRARWSRPTIAVRFQP